MPDDAELVQLQVSCASRQGPDLGESNYLSDVYADRLQMLSRHGSRYPTSDADVANLGKKLKDAAGKFKAKGALEFLNRWTYQLGHEILVPKGEKHRQPPLIESWW